MSDDWDIFNLNTSLDSITVAGSTYKTGDHVRIEPRGRADIMDLALAGKIAVIEAIEQDTEDRIYIAVVLDDDPGKDLGMMRQTGHRFFYSPEEIIVLSSGS